MISTITTKGQVTIPVAIRRQHGIKPNDQVDFITEDKRIILVPVKTLRDFRGAVAGGGDHDLELQTAKDSVGHRVVEEMS